MATWAQRLVGQLDFYWEAHLRPRLDGLTDQEYLWEPASPAWNLHPSGDGRWRMDRDDQQQRDGPITTIAWRMTHLTIEVFETRYLAFFGDANHLFDGQPPPTMWAAGEVLLASGDLPGTAAAAVEALTGAYTRWRDSVVALSDAEVLRPLGPLGGPFADDAMAELVLHLNRETMHHGGEIGLLRDLYRDAVASA